MPTYFTPSDAANSGVRAFLTKVGEFYLGRSFNTRSGQAKKDWIRIQESVFDNSCAYCGTTDVELTIGSRPLPHNSLISLNSILAIRPKSASTYSLARRPQNGFLKRLITFAVREYVANIRPLIRCNNDGLEP